MWQPKRVNPLDLAEPGNANGVWDAPGGELRAGPLAVRVLGQGTPTLLLHGLLGSNRYWGRAFDQLADDGELLAPDLLGFGASPRPVTGYGPEEHGGALVSALQELDVRSPLLVAGHSLGALLALWLACNHPGQVKRVVAFAPPLFRNPEHARRQIRRLSRLEQLFAFDSWTAKTACTNLCQARPKLAAKLFSMVRPEVPYPILEDATRHTWVSYSETVKRVILAADGPSWLASSRCDVLLIAGTEDKALDLEFLRELADQNSHVQLRIWPGAGHDLPLSEAERCLAAIKSGA